MSPNLTSARGSISMEHLTGLQLSPVRGDVVQPNGRVHLTRGLGRARWLELPIGLVENGSIRRCLIERPLPVSIGDRGPVQGVDRVLMLGRRSRLLRGVVGADSGWRQEVSRYCLY